MLHSLGNASFFKLSAICNSNELQQLSKSDYTTCLFLNKSLTKCNATIRINLLLTYIYTLKRPRSVKKMLSDFYSPSLILEHLIQSKETGNVVAIWSNRFTRGLCLTAIEDIQPVEITGDQIITLKKYDLQGGPISNRRISLSEIKEVACFNAIYNEHLLLSIPDDYIDDSTIKIRKWEQSITIDDLKIIFIRNINSGRKIKIRERTTEEVRSCYLREYHLPKEVMLFSPDLNGTDLEEIALSSIEEIEFEFYFYYKGISSIIFKVVS